MNAALEQTIVERLHVLDDTKLVEVLDFVEFLAQRRTVIQGSPPLRYPHTDIAGKLIINGDIFDSAPASDWDLPT